MPTEGDTRGAGCASSIRNERRRRDRRGCDDERRHASAAHPPQDRRRIHNSAGRRVSDRRASHLDLTPRDLRDIEGARQAVRFQGGDSDAFAALYRSYFKDIHVFMSMMLGNETDAEDATQQVFIKVLSALPRFDHHPLRFGGWIFAIARNTALDDLRRRKSYPTDPTILNGIRDKHEPAHAYDHTGDFDVLRLVDALPAQQREIILMRHALGMSNTEVAEAVGRSPDSVCGMHYRAIVALEQALAAARHPAALKRTHRRTRRVRPLPTLA